MTVVCVEHTVVVFCTYSNTYLFECSSLVRPYKTGSLTGPGDPARKLEKTQFPQRNAWLCLCFKDSYLGIKSAGLDMLNQLLFKQLSFLLCVLGGHTWRGVVPEYACMG